MGKCLHCISVQQKSGNDRNENAKQEVTDGHHKQCFIDETKNSGSICPLKQHVHTNLIKTRIIFKTFVDSCGKCALGLC